MGGGCINNLIFTTVDVDILVWVLPRLLGEGTDIVLSVEGVVLTFFMSGRG